MRPTTTIVSNLYEQWCHAQAAVAEKVCDDAYTRTFDLAEKIIRMPSATPHDVMKKVLVLAFDVRQNYPNGKTPPTGIERAIKAMAADAERFLVSAKH